MSIHRTLPVADGFDPATQHTVGFLYASLEDQARRLKTLITGWPAAAFEWQPSPGYNTAGMLLAHNAFVEVAWICVAAQGIPYGPEGKARFEELIGCDWDDDGMPMKPGATPPAALAGKDEAFFVDALDRCRAAIRAELVTWTDASLSDATELKAGTFTRGWILYHVLEHYAQHFGQVSLLAHQMRDAGVLPAAEK